MSARWRGFLHFAISVFAINGVAARDWALHGRKIGDQAQAGRR